MVAANHPEYRFASRWAVYTINKMNKSYFFFSPSLWPWSCYITITTGGFSSACLVSPCLRDLLCLWLRDQTLWHSCPYAAAFAFPPRNWPKSCCRLSAGTMPTKIATKWGVLFVAPLILGDNSRMQETATGILWSSYAGVTRHCALIAPRRKCYWQSGHPGAMVSTGTIQLCSLCCLGISLGKMLNLTLLKGEKNHGIPRQPLCWHLSVAIYHQSLSHLWYASVKRQQDLAICNLWATVSAFIVSCSLLIFPCVPFFVVWTFSSFGLSSYSSFWGASLSFCSLMSCLFSIRAFISFLLLGLFYISSVFFCSTLCCVEFSSSWSFSCRQYFK